jgi:two-component system NtrC family sensor kinase
MRLAIASYFKKLSFQARLIAILVGVIVPVFAAITWLEDRITQPVLEQEMRSSGLNAARSVVDEIVERRLLSAADPTLRIERVIQETLYLYPSILRLEVIARDESPQGFKMIASNIEGPATYPEDFPSVRFLNATAPLSEIRDDEASSSRVWEISVPILIGKRQVGAVFAVVTLRTLERLVDSLFQIKALAAGVSIVLLIFILSLALRKALMNERLLRRAESRNLSLSEQLHSLERQLMTTEKLAVMGQLTATLAHEIGTPLNAVGGHMQLLKDELSDRPEVVPRLDIIESQTQKIVEIVRAFLQSTAKPETQKQLLDLNRVVERTLEIVDPRARLLGIKLVPRLDRTIAPLRAVPLEMEQILLNLLTNSLDSIAEKARSNPEAERRIEVQTGTQRDAENEWAVIRVLDTGEGIAPGAIGEVTKAFYTTKARGKGTGLGLTICQDLVKQYRGVIEIDSQETQWTRVVVQIPFRNIS